MNVSRKFCVGALAAVLLLGLGACGGDAAKSGEAQGASEREVLTVGIDPTYRPFGFYDKDKKLAGYDVDLANAMGKVMGVDIKFEVINFEGLVPSLNDGTIDWFPNILRTPEREKQLLFGAPQFENNVTIVVRAGEPDPGADLAGVRLGVATGTSAEAALQAFGDFHPTTYNTLPDAYTDLLAKRIDAVAVETPTAGYSAKFTYPDKLKVTDQELLKDAAIAAGVVKKGNTELAERLDKALAKVRADGTLDKIETRWFGFPLK
jgi:ABC-type amino acid transport substrate-binding protein